MSDLVTTSIQLSDEVLELVKTDAEKEKRCVSDQIEYIVENYYKPVNRPVRQKFNVKKELLRALFPILAVCFLYFAFHLLVRFRVFELIGQLIGNHILRSIMPSESSFALPLF
jgi:hypothetical protein